MPGSSLLAYLPSPPTNGLSIGPLRLHLYGLLIACGVVAAVWLAQRRWEGLGGASGTFSRLAVWAVPAGLIGARAYSVATSWQADTGGHWYRIFAIWQGGLGIWGGIAVGVVVGLLVVRRYHLDWRAALDCAAPGLALAQGIGRWGNYFNQELYGAPSHLPWAVKITNPVHCTSVTHCVAYPPGTTTFQPTFLYESIWDLACVALLLLAERHIRIRRGYLFSLYAALYCFGRFFTEYLRVDEAHRYFGLRLNDWASIAVFVVAGAIFLLRGIARHGEATTTAPLEPAPSAAPDSPTGTDSPGGTDTPSGTDPGVAADARSAAGAGDASRQDSG